MSNIPDAHAGPNPEAQKIIDYLAAHANEQFTLEQIAQAVGDSEENVQVRLESLEYQSQIEKAHPEGGQAVYSRPRRT